MNTVQARIWRFRVIAGADEAEVEAEELGRGSLPVDLARLVHINALACDSHKVVDHRVIEHEARILTSYLAGRGAHSTLTVDYPAFRASSLHIRRLVSECSGLGVMTASSEALFRWKNRPGALHSFDVLPGHLVPLYGSVGVRPDLLFHVPGGPIAGEARGRHRTAKKKIFPDNPDSQQKNRLLQLAEWSIGKRNHPYFMSWVWISRSGVAADIFVPWIDDRHSSSFQVNLDWLRQRGHKRWKIRTPEHRSQPRTQQVTHEEDLEQAQAFDTSPVTIAGAIERTSAELQAAVSRLYETAPSSSRTLRGVRVRGEWKPADSLGTPTHEIFVGVLAEQLPTS
ncbi:hypothetical protein ACWGOK_42950, partial [Streptomyces eurythermus]